MCKQKKGNKCCNAIPYNKVTQLFEIFTDRMLKKFYERNLP